MTKNALKFGRLLIAPLLLGLVLGACSLLPADETACVTPSALFEDDFEGGDVCGWALYNEGGLVASIEEGVLQMTTSQPGQIGWTNARRSFDDVVVTVQARQAAGPNNNAYGVVCRYQNAANFYLFLVSGDGYYAIGKYQSGSDQITYLTPDAKYQFSDVINQGIATNQLRVSCVGNELSLAVNGLPLLTVTDPTFVNGDIGLGVSTFEPGTAVVAFDNLRVTAP